MPHRTFNPCLALFTAAVDNRNYHELYGVYSVQILTTQHHAAGLVRASYSDVAH